MKTTKIIVATIALGITSAVAGPTGQPGKGKIVQPTYDETPISHHCTAFDGNRLELSLFGSYIFGDKDLVDDTGGIGIAAAWFFNEFVGVQGSYTAILSSPEVHDTAASVVARFPIKDICLAPYVYGGGGWANNSQSQGTGHLGTGLDWRFDPNQGMGVFVDYRYTFADKTDDWQAVSAGLKMNF